MDLEDGESVMIRQKAKRTATVMRLDSRPRRQGHYSDWVAHLQDGANIMTGQLTKRTGKTLSLDS